MERNCCVTTGMFDGVHAGHRCLLRQLRDEAARRGLSAVVVTFARHPKAVLSPDFRPRLLTTPEEKADLLRAEGVERVVTLDFTPQMAALTARRFMQDVLAPLGARVLVAGYDHRFGHARAEGFSDYVAYGKDLGIDVVQAVELDSPAHVSSSVVRRLLSAGDVSAAARLLERPYRLAGRVVPGRKQGRLLGFPTANLCPPADKLVPALGVYACRAEAAGRLWPAMVNIGRRPTLDNGRDVSVEAHLLGYPAGEAGELYGETVALHFVDRLRDEHRFPSTAALCAQLADDAAQVRQILSL